MKIHEYQAKEIFSQYGIPVPKGQVTGNPEETGKIFDDLKADLCVVKAQVHAGGRGKGGGVKLVRSAEEAVNAAKEIMSKPLVTHQTGPEGQPVKTILVEQGSSIEKEYYLGMAVDREISAPVLMASTEGGMEIEVVAKNTPEKILKAAVDPNMGLAPYKARQLAFKLGCQGYDCAR